MDESNEEDQPQSEDVEEEEIKDSLDDIQYPTIQIIQDPQIFRVYYLQNDNINWVQFDDVDEDQQKVLKDPSQIYNILARQSRLISDLDIQNTLNNIPLFNYQNIKLIGSGGESFIYQATHKQNGKVYVLKVSKSFSYQNQKNELKILNSIKNNHKIIKPFEGFYNQDILRYILVFKKQMSYHELISFFKEIQRIQSLEKLPQPTFQQIILKIVISITEILIVLFMNSIVHQDISPNNLVYNRQLSPILIDFGQASQGQQHNKKGFHYSYCSPQQRDPNNQVVSYQDNTYNAGQTLKELLTNFNKMNLGISKHDETINNNIQRIVDEDMVQEQIERRKSIDSISLKISKLIIENYSKEFIAHLDNQYSTFLKYLLKEMKLIQINQSLIQGKVFNWDKNQNEIQKEEIEFLQLDDNQINRSKQKKVNFLRDPKNYFLDDNINTDFKPEELISLDELLDQIYQETNEQGSQMFQNEDTDSFDIREENIKFVLKFIQTYGYIMLVIQNKINQFKLNIKSLEQQVKCGPLINLLIQLILNENCNYCISIIDLLFKQQIEELIDKNLLNEVEYFNQKYGLIKQQIQERRENQQHDQNKDRNDIPFPFLLSSKEQFDQTQHLTYQFLNPNQFILLRSSLQEDREETISQTIEGSDDYSQYITEIGQFF